MSCSHKLKELCKYSNLTQLTLSPSISLYHATSHNITQPSFSLYLTLPRNLTQHSNSLHLPPPLPNLTTFYSFKFYLALSLATSLNSFFLSISLYHACCTCWTLFSVYGKLHFFGDFKRFFATFRKISHFPANLAVFREISRFSLLNCFGPF